MQGQKLMLTESLRAKLPQEQLAALYSAAAQAGHSVLVANAWPELRNALSTSAACLALADWDTLRSAQDGHELFPRIGLCVEGREQEQIAAVPDSQLAGLRQLFGLNSAPGLARDLVGAWLRYSSGQSARPSLGLVDAKKAKRGHWMLSHSRDRALLQEQVSRFLSDCIQSRKDIPSGGISGYPKNLSEVLDEFLMNAIWDASPVRRLDTRAESVLLPSGELVSVEAACDSETMVLTVTDRHGTFPASAMLRPFKFALGQREQAHKVNEGPGGAGLGLFMIVQRVAALVYEIRKGEFTRAHAILRLDQPLRDLQKSPRTILFLES